MAASGIMLYHYLTWTLGDFTSDTFMGRLGVYGVSIFYILSGLTLYYVYFDKMNVSKEDLISFFRKRVFRIFPLLWLVTIVAIILSRTTPSFTKLFLNLTGLFGFIQWDQYFSAGIWSIGNELVFYAFFPFFILLTKRYKILMALLSMLLFGFYIYFAFFKLNAELPLSEQWKHYVNPLNQVFLFLGGFLIGFFLHKIQIKNFLVIIMLLAGLGLFTFFPASGNTINIVTGVNRMVFTACCFLICISFYKLNFQFPEFIHKPLTILGESSYSIYLLHPIVWTIYKGINTYIIALPIFLNLISSIMTTLLISYFSYQYFEKYFMKFGRVKSL